MYLDSGNIEEIKQCLKMGLIGGVTTNPTLVDKDEVDLEYVRELTKGKKFFVQVNGDSKVAMVQHFENLHARFKDTIIYKVPISEQGVEIIRYIKERDKHLEILGTTIYNTLQAMIACEVGCDYLAPYVNRIEKRDENPNVLISSLRNYIDDHGYDIEIVAASFKRPQQVVDALNAGAHTVTISFDLFKDALNDPSVLKDIEVFSKLNNK